MTRFKKVLLLGTMVLTLSASTATAFAASYVPAGSGTDLDALKAQRLELMKEHMSDRVEAGLMTQEQADVMLKWMEKNQAVCNGAGGNGAGYGMMGGYGAGNGYGRGMMGGWNQ